MEIYRERKKRSACINAIKDMYEEPITSVGTVIWDIEEFPRPIGYQESILSSYLFTLPIDELTKKLQDEVTWCMLFIDDIVLIHETSKGVNQKFELWTSTL